MKNYLTLTRQALYDLVWSKPMREVAKDFGISDVGLAKRCAAIARPCARAATLRQKRGRAFVPGILAPGSDSVGPSMTQV